MKRFRKIFEKSIYLFAVFMVMAFVSCNHNIADKGKAVLKIEVADSFRQILPDFAVENLSDIKLYKDSASETNLLGSWKDVDSLTAAEIEVEEGEISLILSANISGTSFTSTKKVVVTKGINVVLFDLSAKKYGEGKGNLDIQITYPKVSSDISQISLVDKEGKTVDAELITEKAVSTNPENQILYIKGSDIPTGEYNIEISILTSDAKKKVSYSDSVLIANGVTSKGIYSCSTFVANGRLFTLSKSADGKNFEASYALTDFIPIVDNVVKGDVFNFDFIGTSLSKSDGIIRLGVNSENINLNSKESDAFTLEDKYLSFVSSVTYKVEANAKSNHASDYKVYFKTKATSADSIQFVASVNSTQNTASRVSPVSITFNCDGGYLASDNKCYAGKNLDVTARRDGFAFLGWYDVNDKKVTEVSSDITELKAKWYDLSVVTAGTEEVFTDITLNSPEYYYYWNADGLESSLNHSSDSNGVVTLESRVDQDFSVSCSSDIPVSKGEKYLISIEVWKDSLETVFYPRFIAKKSVAPSEVVTDWNAGAVYPAKANEYETLTSIYEIQENVNSILLNISAHGAGTFKFKNVSLKKVETKASSTQADVVSIENDVLKVECQVKTTCVTVTDKRNNKVYKQLADKIHYSINADGIKASVVDGLITLKCPDWQEKDFAVLSVGFNHSDPATLEYSVYKKATDSYDRSLYFPQKAVTSEGDYMVLPINEGMAIDYNDFTTLGDSSTGNWYEYSLLISQGQWYSMPFFGITNKTSGAGFISIVKTPDDCYLSYSKKDTNCVGPEWGNQKGKWGYTRNLSQTFFTEGGHVAIAKKYREYAIENGTLVTFEQKKQQRGETAADNIEKLAGAANIWRIECDSALNMEQELKDAGMDRLMLSHQVWKETENIQPVESLITRYDIYQDVFPKEDADSCWTCPDVSWISNKGAYPNEIIIDSNGNYDKAWEYAAKDGGTLWTYALCDLLQPAYAREKMKEELKIYPYSGRFFDTTTTNVKECYSTSHGMTRTQSKKAKYDLLAVSSIENGLVTGSETGADFAVPVCDYFEGMMSLAKARDPDSGGVLDAVKDTAPDCILGVQLNEKLRLPLWELVYHDCCVAYWYWGDSNTLYSSDKIWNKRDDFNALYAVPPMYWVSSSENFQRDKEKIVKSYKKHSYITYNAFGSEMINHEYLTADRSKQRTTFANGLQVTVDFNTDTITY